MQIPRPAQRTKRLDDTRRGPNFPPIEQPIQLLELTQEESQRVATRLSLEVCGSCSHPGTEDRSPTFNIGISAMDACSSYRPSRDRSNGKRFFKYHRRRPSLAKFPRYFARPCVARLGYYARSYLPVELTFDPL
jgi:hypothetical protein